MKYNDPIYGEVEFTGLEEKVIQNNGMQRLKKVHQNGADFLVNPDMDTSRFEHSLGVAILCKKFGCSEEEVVAAIVHDISHTAFSHLADQIYRRQDQTYHEDHHEKFIENYSLDELVEEYGYDPEYIFDEENFSVLERDRPDICADRLDYTLRDLFKYGAIDRNDVDEVLEGLDVEDEVIVANDEETAHRIMDLFMILNKEVFFNEQHEAASMLMVELLEKGMEKGVIKEEDLFKNDEQVLKKLRQDEGLEKGLEAINENISVEKGAEHDRYEAMRKHRIVDPPVKGTGKRLSELSSEANAKFERFKNEVPLKQRYSIKTDRPL